VTRLAMKNSSDFAGDVRLEEQFAEHASQMYQVLKDPRIYEFIDEAPPISEEALRDRYRKLENRASPDGSERWLNWIVSTREGEFIGYVQATIYRDASAEIAFVIASNKWGRGYGFAASQAMLRELADKYGVARVTANTDVRNLRSRCLLTRLGMMPSKQQSAVSDISFEGMLPLPFMISGT